MWGLAGGNWSPRLPPRKLYCILALPVSFLLSVSHLLCSEQQSSPTPSHHHAVPITGPEQGRQPTVLRMGCGQSSGSILFNLEWAIPRNLMVPGSQRAFQDIGSHGCRTLAHGSQSFMCGAISIGIMFNQKVPRPAQDARTAMS